MEVDIGSLFFSYSLLADAYHPCSSDDDDDKINSYFSFMINLCTVYIGRRIDDGLSVKEMVMRLCGTIERLEYPILCLTSWLPRNSYTGPRC
jgi:hypothetical protein